MHWRIRQIRTWLAKSVISNATAPMGLVVRSLPPRRRRTRRPSRTSQRTILAGARAVLLAAVVSAALLGSFQGPHVASPRPATAVDAALLSPMTLTGGPGITTGNAVTTGNVRIFDNSWLGKTTIHVTGPGAFRVLTNLPPQSNAGAYPDVFNGRHYGWQTAGPLPLPTSVVWNDPLWYTGYGTGPTNPASDYLGDFDCWYFNKGASLRGHGQTELVVANRYQGSGSGQLVFIRGTWYRWLTWITSDPTGLRWRLVLFYEVNKTAQLRISMQAFTRFLSHQGFVHAGSWLGSVHYGFENARGGAGETVSFHVGR